MHGRVSFCTYLYNTYLFKKTYFLFSWKLKYFQKTTWQRKKLTERCLQNSPDYWDSTLENMTSCGPGEIIWWAHCSKEVRKCGFFPSLLFETHTKAAAVFLTHGCGVLSPWACSRATEDPARACGKSELHTSASQRQNNLPDAHSGRVRGCSWTCGTKGWGSLPQGAIKSQRAWNVL